MEGLDGEGGTLKFSCVKVFDFMNIYLCFIEGVCVRERQPLPHSANHISGANFPSVCVYSAALLSPQHQSGSESEDLLGQILRYNDRSFYEVKLRARWPVIALMGFSSFSSERSQPELTILSDSNQLNSSLLLTLSESVFRGGQRRCLMI